MARASEKTSKFYILYDRFSTLCVSWVEMYLTKRAQKKQHIIDTQARYIQKFGKIGGKIADWGLAFLWAAIWVFFINQYLIQAYMIPSESMVPALRVGDRVFVNKFFAGPELLPGFQKLPAITQAERAQIIIFSNPELDAGHPILQSLHRLVYMISLSTIDIGGRENMAQLLVKRAVGAHGDQIIFRDGDLYIKPKGMSEFYSEKEFQKISGVHYTVQRLVPKDMKELNQQKAAYRAYQLALTTTHYPPNMQVPAKYTQLEEKLAGVQMGHVFDAGEAAARYSYIQKLYQLMPYDQNVREQFLREDMGIYVPTGMFLPLGDNRDNSRDGRYFGVIKEKSVLGYWLWRFFPFNRLGGVK
ncbi:MAG: signal peptidase I [Spirochaetia bacterium]